MSQFSVVLNVDGVVYTVVVPNASTRDRAVIDAKSWVRERVPRASYFDVLSVVEIIGNAEVIIV